MADKKKDNKKDKTDKQPNFEVRHKISAEELESNPDKARDNFLKNIAENDELRMELWKKMYSRKFITSTGRVDKKQIDQAEHEWQQMTLKDKYEWFDFITDNGKSLGVVGEINYIAQLVKVYRGNMKNVWKALREYGKTKKEEQKNKDGD